MLLRDPKRTRTTRSVNLKLKIRSWENNSKVWEMKRINSYNKLLNSLWLSNNCRTSLRTTLSNSKTEISKTDSTPRTLNLKELPKNYNVLTNTWVNWLWKSISLRLKTPLGRSTREVLKNKTDNWPLELKSWPTNSTDSTKLFWNWTPSLPLHLLSMKDTLDSPMPTFFNALWVKCYLRELLNWLLFPTKLKNKERELPVLIKTRKLLSTELENLKVCFLKRKENSWTWRLPAVTLTSSNSNSNKLTKIEKVLSIESENSKLFWEKRIEKFKDWKTQTAASISFKSKSNNMKTPSTNWDADTLKNSKMLRSNTTVFVNLLLTEKSTNSPSSSMSVSQNLKEKSWNTRLLLNNSKMNYVPNVNKTLNSSKN